MCENLNDDEIMELRILSNELNACETTLQCSIRRSSRQSERGLDFDEVRSGFDNCKSQRNDVGP